MNYHLLFYRTGERIREYRKHLRTKRAYCLLATVTYTNTLLFAYMMFRQHELLVDILFCISSVLIGVSVTGLYLATPCVMLPDVVFKIIMATCALFYAINEADEGNEGSGFRLVLVMFAFVLQFYENYFLFKAIVHLYRRKEDARPPPSYNFFTITAPKAERVEEGSDCSHDNSLTPPPSYFEALAQMTRKMAILPNPRESPTPQTSSDDRPFEILMQTMSLP